MPSLWDYNRLTDLSEWDDELLKIELVELRDAGFDIQLTGFDEKSLDELLAGALNGGLTDPDDVPEAPANPVSRSGDLWLLGPHRLMCGDSTNPEDVARALGNANPHLMVTDPPYGVEYDANWRNEAARAGATAGRKRGVIGGRAIGKVENDDRADWREAWSLFPGDVAYVWHGALNAALVAESLLSAHFLVRAQIIWAKNNIVIGRGDYHWQHEPCWYAVRKGKPGRWAGDRKQSTLWEIDKPQKSETGHSTQKPIECMRRPIENNSVAGDAVYEPFSGSGTTIIAAEMTRRTCIAIELNPSYVDVGVQRWQEFAGQRAILDGDGRDFATVAAARIQIAA